MKLFYHYILIPLLFVCNIALAQPDADFTATPTTACAPITVQFNSASTVQGSSYTHSWNLSGSSSNQANPSKTFITPGKYSISHTVTGPNGTNTVNKTDFITVYASPTVAFSGNPLKGCPPLNVSFSNSSTPGESGATSVTWVFGSSGTSSNQNPTYTFNQTGFHDVSLKVTNSKGCSQTLTKSQYVEVTNKPSGSFSASQTNYCSAPASVSFSATASGAGSISYNWDFGDGSTSTAQNPTHSYSGPAPASYTVKLTITDGNCSETITKNDYIKIFDAQSSFNMSASKICVGDQVTFTSTAPATPTSVEWDFGDGTAKSPAANTAHTFHSSGTFTVTLTTNYGGCTATSTKQITVNPQPNITVSHTPDPLCPAPQTVNFSTSTPAGTTLTDFYWDFNDVINNTSTSPTPSHLYNNNGSYLVLCVGTDQNGCKDTVNDLVELVPMNVFAECDGDQDNDIVFTESDSGCAAFNVAFQASVKEDDTFNYRYPVTYDWDFDDGSTNSTLKSPIHTFVNAGTYEVVLTVTATHGCVRRDTVMIYVGVKPHPIFTATPLNICADRKVYFTNLSVGATSYYWDFGDTSSSRDFEPVHIYSMPDTYTVRLTATDRGCDSTIEKEDYIIVKPAKAIMKRFYSCDTPLKVRFENWSIEYSSHIFYFGDGQSTTSQDPTHTYSSFGTYNAMLIAFNNTTGCTDTAFVDVTLRDPEVDFTANVTKACVGDSVYFTPNINVSVPAPVYDWYINGSYAGFSFGVKKLGFSAPGKYTIKVVCTDERNCQTVKEKTEYIFISQPQVDFEVNDVKGCQPFTANFTDKSTVSPSGTIVSRSWNFGDGNTTTTGSSTSTNIYATKGKFDVTLLVTDDVGCSRSLKRDEYITVQKPEADFATNSNACVDEGVPLTNNSKDATSYYWDFGDGTTSTSPAPTKSYNYSNTFPITLVAIDDIGCTDTFSGTTLEVTKPVASFTMSDSISICPNIIVKFDGSGSQNASTYLWNFGGTNTSGKVNPTKVFNTPQEYDIQLIVTDANGCTDTAYSKVKVLGFSGALTYGPLKGCVPLEVQYTSTVTGTIPSIVWDFDDGTTINSAQTTLNHTYNTPGKYVPRIIFNDNQGCNAVSSGNDTIYVDDVQADFTSTAPCSFTQVELKDASKTQISSITNTYWQFHDSTFSVLPNPKRKYNEAGKYWVKLAVKNAQGCLDTIEKDLTIYDPLPVYAGDDSVICLKDSMTLMPTGGVSYNWSPSTGLGCTNCANPKAAPSVKTEYTVISTDVNGCHDTGKVVVDIKTKVTSIVGEGADICETDTVEINVSGAQTYAWSPDFSLDDATSSNPMAFPRESTKYTVIAYEGSCIPDTQTVNVEVFPKPTVSIRGEKTIVAGASADLIASGEHISRFEWSPSNTLSCADCSNPIANPYKTTTYNVNVYSDKGCADSSKATIKVLCDKSQIFIPNTFTPNGDGVNDIFYVRGAGITSVESFRIYNRWGEVLFERRGVAVNDKANGWDGTHNGVKLPPDVYIYTVEAYCENNELLKFKGDITIIR